MYRCVEGLGSSPTQKHLGVLADSKLNASQQCALVAQKAYRALWCTRPSTATGQGEQLSCSALWGLTSHCVWVPQHKDITLLEGVQRRLQRWGRVCRARCVRRGWGPLVRGHGTGCPGQWAQPRPASVQGNTLRLRVCFLSAPVWERSWILVGPFQLGTFYDSMFYVDEDKGIWRQTGYLWLGGVVCKCGDGPCFGPEQCRYFVLDGT